ncbi:MAG: ATP-binding protein [Saprospiraceae bacterium]|nr:ATP-binding protein [Saprospiraceae bacterium]
MRYVFTGPESSGKSTFCTQAHQKWGGGLVPEIARRYLIDIGNDYTFEDVQTIGKQQMAEEYLIAAEQEYIWCDTDIITVLIWSIDKFGSVDESLYKKWSESDKTQRIYFLCFPDVPWEPDPLRENPYDRERIFLLYQSFLVDHQLDYVVLIGDNEKKWNTIENVFLQKVM